VAGPRDREPVPAMAHTPLLTIPVGPVGAVLPNWLVPDRYQHTGGYTDASRCRHCDRGRMEQDENGHRVR
jgi:hypothetical protein